MPLAAKLSRKPNLIVFLPDQQRADTIACYGQGKVHSPNLGKLASESIVFSRAYVTHPVCTPSRSSLMTGMWPHANGCTRNSVPLDPQFQALPQLLQNKDYHTAYIGKWHLGDEAIPQRGFQKWVSTEGVSDYSRFLIEMGLTPDKPDGSFTTLAVSNLPLDLSKPKFLEERAIQFIERHRGEPFILVVAFAEPHSPYNGPLNNEHALSEVELDFTATAPLTDNIPLRYRLMREWQQAEAALDRKRRADLFFFGITPDEYRSIKQRYLGLVTLIDQSIGAILDSLEKTGLTDNTIVVHTSDHGDSMGAHQLFAKEVMFEEMAPESIFIEWAPNRTKIKKGTSLAPRRMVKRAVEESTRTVISPDGWKLSLRDKDLNELYNLADDPFETRNLYSDRQCAAIISRYADEIHCWQESVKDTLRI